MEKVIHPNTFIITACALGWSEEQFFEVLIEKYPEDLDFRKVRTLAEYQEFRRCLATKFLTNADIDILRKTSIALLNDASPSTQSIPTNVEVTKPITITRRQGKNRRSRKNKSSKAPTEPPVIDHLARKCTELGWPAPIEPPSKRPRVSVPFEPTTPAKPWVTHMPICNFFILVGKLDTCRSTQRTKIKELTTTLPLTFKPGKFASRSVDEAEYRHKMGLHRLEDECDICDCAFRYHFLDDFFGVQSRIIALIALHHWIQHGAEIPHFNWCPQTWMDQMYVDGRAVQIEDIGPIIRRYIDSGRVQTHNDICTYPDGDMLTVKTVRGKDPDPAICFRLTR
jgi:hypothetical protein